MEHALLGLLCLILCGSNANGDFAEKVTTEGASGGQVVGHVVDLIGRLCILDNELFLRRMAYVETKDGTSPETYRDGYNGGIWNIDEGMFNVTKNNPNLAGVYALVEKQLNIDWANVTWSDLRKPLVSGIAATMFLVSRSYQRIPESHEVQAAIWGTLRPQNSPNTFFFETLELKTVCNTDKELDIVVVLDFSNITTLEVARVQTFLETIFADFPLSLNATRVGLVTKNLRPTAGWFLNSQRPGFTIITALKALKFIPGPTVTGDALKFAREVMFIPANGGRQGAAKVVLLLTDVTRQFDYAKNETNKLKDQGISLVIVEVNKGGSGTGRQRLETLVDPPRCRNVRITDGYDTLSQVKEELVISLCNATVSLVDGDYEFTCQSPVAAKLPSSLKSVSLEVSTTGGSVDVFASKSYTEPDESANDVHFSASQTDGQTLFVRGTDPMYIQVKSQNCTGNYTIHIKTGIEPAKDKNGTCVIAGTVRPCTSREMSVSLHDIVLIPDTEFPSLCDSSNNSIEYYPHPREQNGFLMCDRHENQYVGLCPVNQSSCVQLSSGCKYSNPCSRDAIVRGNMYHNDPCGEPAVYLKCTQFGVAEMMTCPRAKIWNLDTEHCVFRYVHDPFHNIDDTTIDNPCVHSHEDHVYFPYPNEASRYIFCDKYGNAFMSTCRNGVWNQQTKSCTLISRPVG